MADSEPIAMHRRAGRLRSPYRMHVVVLVVTFVVIALVLVAVSAVKQHTCLVEMQADSLGGLPASGIPALCASRFHTHVEHSLVVAGAIALVVAPAVAIWTMSGPRRRRPNRA